MATRNDVTGDSIVSRASNNKYSEGWDRIFGKKEPAKESYDPNTIEEDFISPHDADKKFTEVENLLGEGLDVQAMTPPTGKIFDLKSIGVPCEGTKLMKEKKRNIPILTYTVSDEEYARAQKWLKEEVYPEIIAKQKLDPNYPSWKMWMGKNGEEYPYSGACGGAVTMSFTQTSIGLIIKVTAYGKTLDLTDYDSF
jgi:hypothetical protein